MRNIVKRFVIASLYFSVIVVTASTIIAIEAIEGDEVETPDTAPPADE